MGPDKKTSCEKIQGIDLGIKKIHKGKDLGFFSGCAQDAF